jgi:hypothetical protein
MVSSRLGIMLFVCAMSPSAHAARLVVLAVNSGGDLRAPYQLQPPTMTPGAKVFLIGIDTEDDSTLESALAVSQLRFVSTPFGNVVNQQVDHPNDGQLLRYPKILRLSEAQAFGNPDEIDYRRDDSYIIDNATPTPAGTQYWSLFYPDEVEPSPRGSAIDFTASFGALHSTDRFVVPVAYVVTTGCVDVSGVLLLGSEMYFDVLGGHYDHVNPSVTEAHLDFATGKIVPGLASEECVAEPASWIMASLVAAVLAVSVWRRKTTSARGLDAGRTAHSPVTE